MKYSLLAGERALAAYAHEEALAQFQRALTAKEGQPMDAETAEILYGLGRSQFATLERHQFGEALSCFNRAFDYYAGVNNIERAVAIAESPFLPAMSEYRTEQSSLMSKALGLVLPDSHEAGRLLPRYGRVMGVEEGNYPAAREAFGRALSIARRHDDALLELSTMANAMWIDFRYMRYAECLGRVPQALELVRKLDATDAEVVVRFWAAFALISTGLPDDARQHGEALLAAAEKLRVRYWMGRAFLVLQSVEGVQGNLRKAREFSNRGLDALPNYSVAVSERVYLEYEVGDFSRGAGFLENLIESLEFYTNEPSPSAGLATACVVIPLVARLTGGDSNLGIAEDAAKTVLSFPTANQRK